MALNQAERQAAYRERQAHQEHLRADALNILWQSALELVRAGVDDGELGTPLAQALSAAWLKPETARPRAFAEALAHELARRCPRLPLAA